MARIAPVDRVGPVFIREQLATLRHVWSTGPARRAALRRAVALRELGDGLGRIRPPGWSLRAQRAYAGVARRLTRQPFSVPVPDGDPATVAHLMIREARRPVRAAAVAAAKLFAWVAVPGALLVLLLVNTSPRVRDTFFPPNVAEHARWEASSKEHTYRTSGRLPTPTDKIFFHTKRESYPWIRIDLPESRKLRAILIENRSDCCAERALPLDVLVPDGSGWRRVCQRRAPFSTWTCEFPPVFTNQFEIMVAGENYLHLRGVAAFE